MKKIKFLFIVLIAPLSMMWGCELVGLDLQEKYDYDANAGLRSNELNKTVWEFLNSRTDEFSLMIEGIEYAELTDKYNEPNSTYMALTNIAVTSYFISKPLTVDPLGVPTSYAVSLTQFPKEVVQEFLLYHIAKGAYTWNNLPPVPTWYDTYASADTAKVNLYLMKNDRSPTIGFNDFATHYKAGIRARSTNLKSTSGSYVHALDSWLDYPTRATLEGN